MRYSQLSQKSLYQLCDKSPPIPKFKVFFMTACSFMVASPHRSTCKMAQRTVGPEMIYYLLLGCQPTVTVLPTHIMTCICLLVLEVLIERHLVPHTNNVQMMAQRTVGPEMIYYLLLGCQPTVTVLPTHIMTCIYLLVLEVLIERHLVPYTNNVQMSKCSGESLT
jgi:hypothetical protein